MLSPAACERAAQKRAQTRADRAADAEASLLAEATEKLPECTPRNRPVLRFRVTVECLTDGAKASFTTCELLDGLSISPTLAGRRVSAVLKHYRPEPAM